MYLFHEDFIYAALKLLREQMDVKDFDPRPPALSFLTFSPLLPLPTLYMVLNEFAQVMPDSALDSPSAAKVVMAAADY